MSKGSNAKWGPALSGMRSGAKLAAGLIGILAAIVGIAAIFQPNLRQWMLSHAPLGWALAIIFAIVACFAFGIAGSLGEANQGLQSAVVDLRVEADDGDRILLNERLMGWRQGDRFMQWLADGFIPDSVPTEMTDQIDRHSRSWDQDLRAFTSAHLQGAFDQLRAAADAFYDLSLAELWLGRDTHFGYLEMRARPGDDDRVQVWEAIEDAARSFLDALRNMFAVAHAERVVLEPVTNAKA
jgi:hypothetical protein